LKIKFQGPFAFHEKSNFLAAGTIKLLLRQVDFLKNIISNVISISECY